MPDIQAVILAAGAALRLRPFTITAPKCLLDLGGATLLGRMLQNLRANGIYDIVIMTGYLEEQIHAYVQNHASNMRVRFLSNPLYSSTNNIYSLWLTRALVEGKRMLLLDSDILFDPDIIRLCLESGHDTCLAVKSGMPLGAEEIKVRTDAYGLITQIGKEIDPAGSAGESIGIELFGRHDAACLFAILNDKITVRNQVNQFYEAAFQEAIDEGMLLHAVDVGNRQCMEIDTVEDLRLARGMISR
jgi:choline kinase